LEGILGRSALRGTRALLEDGRAILDEAMKGTVAILCMGDPFTATTHVSLRLRAIERGIRVKTFYSSSILNAVFGETGLHCYKVGRVVSLIRAAPAALVSVYMAVKDCLQLGLHSLLLLEYNYDEGYHLSPSEGLKMLQELESSYKMGVFTDDRLVVVASRVGWPSQTIVAGPLRDLIRLEFGQPPHCMIFPGPLHFSEEEAMAKMLGSASAVKDAVAELISPSKAMVERTITKTLAALSEARRIAHESSVTNLEAIFENVEAYLSDARRFLMEGKPELALMEAGYAEGLLDAIRLQGTLKMTW